MFVLKRIIKNVVVFLGCLFAIFILGFIVVNVGLEISESLNDENNKWREISSLEVRVYTENEEGIYYIKYPYSYYKVTQEGGGRCIRYEMTNALSDSEISEKDFNYLTGYIRELSDNSYTEKSKIAYEIMIEYYDSRYSDLKYEHIIGYDEFPQGWNRFIKTVNKVCGDKYLTSKGDIVELTPQLLTEWFGVTDADVQGGMLQDVIDYNNLNMSSITQDFSMHGAIEAYHISNKADLLAPYIPTEYTIVDSTDEEYELFIQELLASDADNMWVEKGSSQINLRYFYSEVTGQSFYLGQTSKLDPGDILYIDYYNCYKMDFGIIYSSPFVDGGPIDLVDFVYSPCGKYVFAYRTCPDLIYDFLEIEINE